MYSAIDIALVPPMLLSVLLPWRSIGTVYTRAIIAVRAIIATFTQRIAQWRKVYEIIATISFIILFATRDEFFRVEYSRSGVLFYSFLKSNSKTRLSQPP